MTVKRQPCHLALQWGDKWLGRRHTFPCSKNFNHKEEGTPLYLSLSFPLNILEIDRQLLISLRLEKQKQQISCVGFRLSFLTFFWGGEMRHVGQKNRLVCEKAIVISAWLRVLFPNRHQKEERNVRKVLAEKKRNSFTFFVFSVCRRLRIFVAQDVEVEWFQGRYGRITRICCNTKKNTIEEEEEEEAFHSTEQSKVKKNL